MSFSLYASLSTCFHVVSFVITPEYITRPEALSRDRRATNGGNLERGEKHETYLEDGKIRIGT